MYSSPTHTTVDNWIEYILPFRPGRRCQTEVRHFKWHAEWRGLERMVEHFLRKFSTYSAPLISLTDQ